MAIQCCVLLCAAWHFCVKYAIWEVFLKSLLEFEEAGTMAAKVNNHLVQLSHCQQTETARLLGPGSSGDQELPP